MRDPLIVGILWITIFLEPLFHWYTIWTYGLSLSTLKTGGFDLFRKLTKQSEYNFLLQPQF